MYTQRVESLFQFIHTAFLYELLSIDDLRVPSQVYGYLQLCVTIGMMTAAMLGTPMSRKQVLGNEGWRVACFFVGSFAVFTAFLAT